MAKKILALALAAAYFGAANCRFACAMGLSAPAPAVAAGHGESGESACHHRDETQNQSQKRGDPAPCCMSHFDNALALLPANVATAKAPLVASLVPAVPPLMDIPLVRVRAYGENHGPPLVAFEGLDPSSVGPRAPPSFLVVL